MLIHLWLAASPINLCLYAWAELRNRLWMSVCVTVCLWVKNIIPILTGCPKTSIGDFTHEISCPLEISYVPKQFYSYWWYCWIHLCAWGQDTWSHEFMYLFILVSYYKLQVNCSVHTSYVFWSASMNFSVGMCSSTNAAGTFRIQNHIPHATLAHT